ncbi:MAG: NAD(P)/FAD-dependent oxidoreductase [Rhodocyclales bacterium]|nr:NAD(P)/FAD-dependent oxidoreductase [Rhodocyclales bacterium]
MAWRCDVSAELRTNIAVVGAGPAGLAAAHAALAQGADVTLIDDNPSPGGQIWRGTGLARGPNVKQARLLASTRVVAAPQAGSLLLESMNEGQVLRYRRLVVATGARERMLPFPGWTLPGVTGAGGLQALVKGGLDVRGQRAVLAGSGPLLLAAAAVLQQAGAQVVLIAEQVSAAALARFAWALRAYPDKLMQAVALRWSLRAVPYHSHAHVLEAVGDERVRGVRIQHGERIREIACDWLGVGFGLIPNTELPQALGCDVAHGAAVVDALVHTSVAGVYAPGEACGIGGVDKAQLEGRIAGLAAAGADDAARALVPRRAPQLRFASLLQKHFALRPELLQTLRPDTLICRCEDVSHAQLSQFDSSREAKLLTRCGMGACQARMCGPICADLYGWVVDGHRPPLQPARLATLMSEPSNHDRKGVQPS